VIGFLLPFERQNDVQTHPSTTPFGRRSLTLAHVAGQVLAKRRDPDAIVNKWAVFQ